VRIVWLSAAGLLAAPILGLALAHGSDLTGTDPATGKAPPAKVVVKPAVAAKPPVKDKAEGTCTGDYGTSIEFEETPKAAAERAKKEQKLVFVLHVSGYFEDPGLT
jgi:hypothetical protein